MTKLLSFALILAGITLGVQTWQYRTEVAYWKAEAQKPCLSIVQNSTDSTSANVVSGGDVTITGSPGTMGSGVVTIRPAKACAVCTKFEHLKDFCGAYNPEKFAKEMLADIKEAGHDSYLSCKESK